MKDETVIDLGLDTLDRATEPAIVEPLLESVVTSWRGAPLRVRNVTVEIVRQRRKRCVLRYGLELEDASRLGLIGKLFLPGNGEPIYAKMRELWARGFDRDASDGVRIPEALTFVPELRLLVQEEVPGLAFKQRLLEAGSPELMRGLAKLLIKLHSQRSWPGPSFRMPRHLARCHPAHPVLTRERPDLAEQIEFIVRRSQELEARVSDDDFCAIHGDLHLSQILIDADHHYLIDLDSLARGDPAADLANLLVFLRSNRRVPDLPGLIDALLDEYFRHMDPRIRHRIPVYEAATQLRRACKDLRFRKPGWEERAGRRISTGVACLESVQLDAARSSRRQAG